MSGHSHWHGIRHKKALTDAKKANVFTKYGKLISIAAREGGGDPIMNVKLRLAIEQARAQNMPKDNIERAIKRGTGELKGGGDIQEVIYEGYGPGQVAMMIKTATDNKNRTVSEVKNFLNKAGGQMVSSGSVGYLFKSVGMITLELDDSSSLDDVELTIIEAGADDIIEEEGLLIVLTDPKNLKDIESELGRAKFIIKHSTLGFWPLQKTNIDEDTQKQYDILLEQLDEQEDVQDIYDNL